VDRVLRLRAAAAARARRGRLGAGRAIADEDVEVNRRHRRARPAAAARHRGAQGRGARPAERADALQRRLAGHGGLGHGHWRPIYQAHAAGLPLHVWVDETRPRNQGASLTAWELGQAGVPHTVIADNAGGHLMQHGQVDLVIVGCDRVTARGDVCNKIGTYLKALAAHDNGVPFYVAMPTSTLDLACRRPARDPDRGAQRARGHAPGRPRAAARWWRCSSRPTARRRQPGLRRDAGAAGHGADHRARRGAADEPRCCALDGGMRAA
jgi:hypothetical protein